MTEWTFYIQSERKARSENGLYRMEGAICIAAEWIRMVQYLATLQSGNVFIFLLLLSFYKVNYPLTSFQVFSLITYYTILVCSVQLLLAYQCLLLPHMLLQLLDLSVCLHHHGLTFGRRFF
jgi:hypothetical protein